MCTLPAARVAPVESSATGGLNASALEAHAQELRSYLSRSFAVCTLAAEMGGRRGGQRAGDLQDVGRVAQLLHNKDERHVPAVSVLRQLSAPVAGGLRVCALDR